MKYFIQCTRFGNTCYMSYEGQAQDVIISMLTALGATGIQFIDQATYNTAIATQGK
jgi:hypothetical protein